MSLCIAWIPVNNTLHLPITVHPRPILLSGVWDPSYQNDIANLHCRYAAICEHPAGSYYCSMSYCWLPLWDRYNRMESLRARKDGFVLSSFASMSLLNSFNKFCRVSGPSGMNNTAPSNKANKIPHRRLPQSPSFANTFKCYDKDFRGTKTFSFALLLIIFMKAKRAISVYNPVKSLIIQVPLTSGSKQCVYKIDPLAWEAYCTHHVLVSTTLSWSRRRVDIRLCIPPIISSTGYYQWWKTDFW